MIRETLLGSLADYIDFDEAGLEVKITKTEEGINGRPALIANIPIKNMKR
jgi:cell division topological specificity factor